MFNNHYNRPPYQSPPTTGPHFPTPTHSEAHAGDADHASAWTYKDKTGRSIHGTNSPRPTIPTPVYHPPYPPAPVPVQVPEYPVPHAPLNHPAPPNQDTAHHYSQDARYTQLTATYTGPPASTITQAAEHDWPAHNPLSQQNPPIDPRLSHSHLWGNQVSTDESLPLIFPAPFASTHEVFATSSTGHHGDERRLRPAPMSQYPPPLASSQPSPGFSVPPSGPGPVHGRSTSYQECGAGLTPSGMPWPSHGHSACITPGTHIPQVYQPCPTFVPSFPLAENPAPGFRGQTSLLPTHPSSMPNYARLTPVGAPPPSQPPGTSAHRLSASSPAFIPAGLAPAGMPVHSQSRSPASWVQSHPAAPSVPPSFPSSTEESSSPPIVTEPALHSRGLSFPLPRSDHPPAPSCSERDSPESRGPVISNPPLPRSDSDNWSSPFLTSGHKPVGPRATYVASLHKPCERINPTPPSRPPPPVGRSISDDYPPLPGSAQAIAQPLSRPSPRMSPRVAQLGSSPTFAQVVGQRGISQSTVKQHHAYPVNHERCTGKKKALLVGIDYADSRPLLGAVKDAHNMKHFLIRDHGFTGGNIRVLTDGMWPANGRPTRDNILKGIVWLVEGARRNDSLVFLFSGHGWQVKDLDGDERDGQDEVIAPVDWETEGTIVDDLLHKLMVKCLPIGCQLVALVDACNSGSALDLPYYYDTSGRLKPSEVTQAFMMAKTAPADVIMWSGCKDKEKADDADDGGAMVSAFMQVVKPNQVTSVLKVHVAMRAKIKGKHDQKTQLSCSHQMDIKHMPFKL